MAYLKHVQPTARGAGEQGERCCSRTIGRWHQMTKQISSNLHGQKPCGVLQYALLHLLLRDRHPSRAS
eukprot:scaffold1446_cov391-Prasinococcus_capsulatus_cf.AAC.18